MCVSEKLMAFEVDIEVMSRIFVAKMSYYKKQIFIKNSKLGKQRNF